MITSINDRYGLIVFVSLYGMRSEMQQAYIDYYDLQSRDDCCRLRS